MLDIFITRKHPLDMWGFPHVCSHGYQILKQATQKWFGVHTKAWVGVKVTPQVF